MVGRKIRNVILSDFYNTVIPMVPLEVLPISTRTKESMSSSDSLNWETIS